jgi:hypothetical protein
MCDRIYELFSKNVRSRNFCMCPKKAASNAAGISPVSVKYAAHRLASMGVISLVSMMTRPRLSVSRFDHKE